MKVSIIGGGISGLAAALILQNDVPDAEVVIIEPNPTHETGATLTKAYQTADGVFLGDLGGHFFHHANYQRIFDLVPGLVDHITFHNKNAFVQVGNQHILAPLQFNIDQLDDKEISAKVLAELKEAEGKEDNTNSLGDMLLNRYGQTMFDIFFSKYNTKMYDLISANDMFDIKVAAQEQRINTAIGTTMYNADFFYPKEGGISTLTLMMERQLKSADNPPTWINKRVDDINKYHDDLSIELEDGRMISTDYIINTAPLSSEILTDSLILDHLVNEYEFHRNKTLKNTLQGDVELRTTSAVVINIGVKANELNKVRNWAYYTDHDFIYRIGSYSTVSDTVAPDGFASLYVEVKGEVMNQVNWRQQLEKEVVEFLVEQGWSDSTDYSFMDMMVVRNNYPLHHPSQDVFIEDLENQGIYSVGRWATWKWKSMHNSFIDAEIAIQKIKELQQ